jgi:predicted DNA-binding ribbon-helix-helix protein
MEKSIVAELERIAATEKINVPILNDFITTEIANVKQQLKQFPSIIRIWQT